MVEGTPYVKNRPRPDIRSPKLDTNNTFASSFRLSDSHLEDYRGLPNNLPTSELESSCTSPRSRQGSMERNDASYQKIPRPWASKLEEMGPAQLDARSLRQIPRTTNLNCEPLLRWYGETIAQGPYHNTGSVRNTSVAHSHEGSPRTTSAYHAPSQNSAAWGSSGQSHE